VVAKLSDSFVDQGFCHTLTKQLRAQRQPATRLLPGSDVLFGVVLVVDQAKFDKPSYELVGHCFIYPAPGELRPQLHDRVGLPREHVEQVVPGLLTIRRRAILGSPPPSSTPPVGSGVAHRSTCTGSRRAARLAGKTPAMTLVANDTAQTQRMSKAWISTGSWV